MPTAIKSVKQSYLPTPEIVDLLETFRKMVNDCIGIGLQNDVSSMKRLCNLAYKQLANYDVLSYYKLCAISHAAGMLSNRRKSIKRGYQPRQPYAKRAFLISCYGFKVVKGVLRIPIGSGQYYNIPLNHYVKGVLSDPLLKLRSFTISANNTLSICYSREVTERECTSIKGIDRNLGNLSIGNSEQVIQYDMSKIVQIAENTRSITRSFKRNDHRIRKRIYSKYGLRRKNRINQILHRVSKRVANDANRQKTAIAFEDIRYIRRLYQRGNGQARGYRAKMHMWSFAEVKRQIEYKAAWEGIPVIQLSVKDTRGTSQLCPRCGKKITQVDRKTRQLWCDQCKRWMDRDVIAAMNISTKAGWSRVDHSKGAADEVMKGNLERDPVILRVDAAKLGLWRRSKT